MALFKCNFDGVFNTAKILSSVDQTTRFLITCSPSHKKTDLVTRRLALLCSSSDFESCDRKFTFNSSLPHHQPCRAPTLRRALALSLLNNHKQFSLTHTTASSHPTRSTSTLSCAASPKPPLKPTSNPLTASRSQQGSQRPLDADARGGLQSPLLSS